MTDPVEVARQHLVNAVNIIDELDHPKPRTQLKTLEMSNAVHHAIRVIDGFRQWAHQSEEEAS